MFDLQAVHADYNPSVFTTCSNHANPDIRHGMNILVPDGVVLGRV